MKKIALSLCLVFVLISCSQKEESNLNVPDTPVVEEDKGELTFEDTTLNLKVTLTKAKRVWIYFERKHMEKMAMKFADEKYPLTDKNGIALRISEKERSKLSDKNATCYMEQIEIVKKNLFAKYGLSKKILDEITNEALISNWDNTEENPFSETTN